MVKLLGHECKGPQAIRYPRGGEASILAQYGCTGREYDFLVEMPQAQVLLVSYGSEVEDILAASELMNSYHIPNSVCKLVKVFPFTDKFLRDIAESRVILFAEECVEAGGIGEHLLTRLMEDGWKGQYLHRGVDNTKLTHATVPQLKNILGLDAEHLVQMVQTALTEKKERI